MRTWHNFNVLSQHFLGGTEEIHENLRIAGLRDEIELGTSRIRSRSVNHSSTALFAVLVLPFLFSNDAKCLVSDLQFELTL
jgi:hypothetical protein